MRYETQLSRGSESGASEEAEGTREEQFAQTGKYDDDDDAGLLIAKDAKEDEQEENGDGTLYTRGRDETPPSDEYEEHANTRLFRLTGDVVSEHVEESRRIAGDEKETETSATPDDHQRMDETSRNIQVREDDNETHEDERDLEAEDVEVKLRMITDLSLQEEDNVVDAAVTREDIEDIDDDLLASANKNKSDGGAKRHENPLSVYEELSDDDRDFKGDLVFSSPCVEIQMTYDRSGTVSEDELNAAGRERVIALRSESNKVEDVKEKEDERDQEVTEEENVNEAANNQTMDEVLEIKTVTEDSQEEDAKTEQHTVEYTEGEQEDMAEDTDVETKTRGRDDVETESCGTVSDEKTDVTTADALIEEERLSGEVINRESYTAVACAATSEVETGQEIRGEFKNTPLGICEGRLVLQELNSPACEEIQEGVPEYNNEPGPDENTTQRFLEEGDSEEIQATQLPEKVESREPESLQNSGCSSGADYLLVREHREEEQESTGEIKTSVDLVIEEYAELPKETEKPVVERVIQDPALLSEEEEGKLLVDSMKTGIEYSEKEFETLVGFTDEANKTTKELAGGTEELLVEFEIDDGLCDTKGADAAGDVTESRFLTQSVEAEPKLLEDGRIDMQDAGIDMDEAGCAAEEEAGDDEMQNKNEMEILNLQVAGLAAELNTEKMPKEKSFFAESELFRAVEPLERKHPLSEEALEISNEETEAADESGTTEFKQEDLTAISTEQMSKHVAESEGSTAEETVGSVSGPQDVIEEEILDLWMQALSEEEEFEPEQQVAPFQEPSNMGQDDILSVQREKDEEQPVESELVSDTEMSSSTAESGFLDQSPCNCETQPPKSTSAGSLHGIHDMLANMSESEPSAQHNFESQDTLMQETAERSYLKEEESIIETGYHPDSGVTSSEPMQLNQELDKSGEKADEESGSERETDAEVTDLGRKRSRKDAEEADVKSLTDVSALIKGKETKVEDEPLEITAMDSDTESRSGSEASLEDGDVSTESDSQGDTRAEVAEHPTAKSKDHAEADASVLDFSAQRSRIAVKNPRVRPPKDPRSLLHMPSVDPTPTSHLPVKVPVGVPLGGLGIGIKLPGLGAGFPLLKKTQGVVRDENKPDNVPQESETKPEEKNDTLKQEEAQHKPKWMPPKHPGFGNPLMSELKTKLKRTTKE
ncbi:enolase-phosphatase E1 [Pempheris klunzingeri]|uniref:enolase-phosphatase E1 n=1 Tax=Pempheris klunzingeri TaxID=3127111 RepID=UPI003980ACA7